MSIQVTVTCDKCGIKTEIDGRYIVSNPEVKTIRLPRCFSYFEVPGQRHICFTCADNAMELSDEPN